MSLPLHNGLSYRHLAVIDFMLGHPHLAKGDIAARLNYTPAYFSQLINSDMFQAEFARRRAELEEDLAHSVIRQQFRVALTAGQRVLDELEKGEECDAGYALDASSRAVKALGFGPTRSGVPTHVTNNVQQNNFNVPSPADKPKLEEARRRLEQVSRMTLIEGHVEPEPA